MRYHTTVTRYLHGNGVGIFYLAIFLELNQMFREILGREPAPESRGRVLDPDTF